MIILNSRTRNINEDVLKLARNPAKVARDPGGPIDSGFCRPPSGSIMLAVVIRTNYFPAYIGDRF